MRPHRVRLVAYDIADAKRLERVASICLDYGTRVQKSLFECTLPDETFRAMWKELQQAIDPETDCVAAYPVCRACLRQATVAGKVLRRGGRRWVDFLGGRSGASEVEDQGLGWRKEGIGMKSPW